jgi:2-methylisocitrate lyase-like PEP mutase family enzyme
VLCEATPLPVSVDLENGFGPAPADAAEAIERIASAGAVGASIEDYDRDSGEIYSAAHAAKRIAAAVEAARGLDFPLTLTARAENMIRGNPDLADTIARLRAYEEAGVDVLFAPGLRDADQIQEVASAITKPLSVLAVPGLSGAEMAAAGAQRISLGGRLASTAVAAMASAAHRIAEAGDFSAIAGPARVSMWLSS